MTTSLNDQELSRTAIPGTYFPLGISTVTYTFNFPELPQFSLNCSFIVNVKAGKYQLTVEKKVYIIIYYMLIA